jgi:hypothetical protein
MNRSGADAECFSRFEDSCAGRQLLTDALDNFHAYRATPEPLSLVPCPRKARFDPLDDHGALEFAEHAEHLKHRPSGWRAGIEALLMQIQIHALGVQFTKKRDEILQRATKPIYRPSGNLVELAARNAETEPVVSGPLVASLVSADPGIAEDCDYIPAVPLGDGLKLSALVLDGLLCCGDPKIQRNTLLHGHNLSVLLYKRQVIFVWLTELAADEDYRGFHGPDFEGISV